MPRAYSEDLRIRVAKEAAEGTPVRIVAQRYGVGPTFVWRMRNLWQKENSVSPKKQGGHKRFMLEPYKEKIGEKIDQSPSITIAELKAWLKKEHQVQVVEITLWYFVKKLGFRYKKNGARIGARTRRRSEGTQRMGSKPQES